MKIEILKGGANDNDGGGGRKGSGKREVEMIEERWK